MRDLSQVISQIQILIPAIVPDEIADNITVLQAELRIISRTGSFTPPEAEQDADLWLRLSTALYRYLPQPTFAPWVAEISALVTGQSAGAQQ